jgi:threonine aldolase
VRAIPYLNITKAQIRDAIGIIASVAEAHADKAGTATAQAVRGGAGY